MTSIRTIIAALAIVALGTTTALAAKPDKEEKERNELRGHDRAIASITEAMTRTEAHLTALLDKVPESAHEGIQRAIEASRAGREKALAALEGKDVEDPDVDDPDVEDPEGDDPDADDDEDAEAVTADTAEHLTGKDRARMAIEEGAKKAEAALTAAMDRAGDPAADALQRALENVRSNRGTALAALDRVKPERAERPDRPDRPEVGGAKDRPQRPDRPEKPERPNR